MTHAFVSLCMIVRNEEKNLEACIAPVRDLVKEIVVVDTGSTDSTREIARRLGAKVIDFRWIDDFSAARRESVHHASGDWIFWLDADDRIDAANRERLLLLFSQLGEVDLRQPSVLTMTCQSHSATSGSTQCQSHIRLFPNSGAMVWEGRIHERLTTLPGLPPARVILTDVVIRHLGYEDAATESRKRSRDMRILEQDYLVNPDNPSTLYYLARDRAALNRFADALRLLQRFISLGEDCNFSKFWPPAHELIVHCMERLNRLDEALQLSRQAVARYRDDMSLLYQLGRLLQSRGCLAEAEAWLLRLVSATTPNLTMARSQPDFYMEEARLLLGHNYRARGMLGKAIAEYQVVVKARPQCAKAWYFLGQTSLAAGQRQGLDEIVHSLAQCADAGAATSTLRAMVCFTDGDFSQSRHWIESAMVADSESPYLHVMRSEILYFQGGDLDESIKAHEIAIALNATNAVLNARLAELQARRASIARAEQVSPETADHRVPAAGPELGNSCSLM